MSTERNNPPPTKEYSFEEWSEIAALRCAMLRETLLNPEALYEVMEKHKDKLLDHSDLQEIAELD